MQGLFLSLVVEQMVPLSEPFPPCRPLSFRRPIDQNKACLAFAVHRIRSFIHPEQLKIINIKSTHYIANFIS